MLAASIGVPLVNPGQWIPPQKTGIIALCLGYIFWMLTLFCLSLWLCRLKCRLVVSDLILRREGLFTGETIDLQQVDKAQWIALAKAAGVVLESQKREIPVWLNLYSDGDVLEQLLRERIPLEKQAGYEQWVALFPQYLQPAEWACRGLLLLIGSGLGLCVFIAAASIAGYSHWIGYILVGCAFLGLSIAVAMASDTFRSPSRNGIIFLIVAFKIVLLFFAVAALFLV